MIDAMQRFIFETSILDPLWSAIASGFAVVVFGEVYLTEAGERYLEDVAAAQ